MGTVKSERPPVDAASLGELLVVSIVAQVSSCSGILKADLLIANNVTNFIF